MQLALGFLRGAVAAGRCASLLDVGSGRGAFLFPLLRHFPDLTVTSLDMLPHRVELLQDLARGGITRLTAIEGDICTTTLPDKAFDVVALLEVMEHIPDTAAVVRSAVRLARYHILVSVPSQPDDNPEHIHLFTRDRLVQLFTQAGCRTVKFQGVNGHHFMIATL
ncbi:MAG: class I SAM-dependent methyltransferase [Muribaculaceae bacterium]|nr:class I SAM-dependent methyltransferase [Muribaculaceae bacterium]